MNEKDPITVFETGMSNFLSQAVDQREIETGLALKDLFTSVSIQEANPIDMIGLIDQANKLLQKKWHFEQTAIAIEGNMHNYTRGLRENLEKLGILPENTPESAEPKPETPVDNLDNTDYFREKFMPLLTEPTKSRAFNAIRRGGVSTFRQLFSMSQEEIMGVINMGPATYHSLQEMLDEIAVETTQQTTEAVETSAEQDHDFLPKFIEVPQESQAIWPGGEL